MLDNARKVYYTAKVTPVVFVWPMLLTGATVWLTQLESMLFYLSIVTASFALFQWIYQLTKVFTFRIFVTDKSIMITKGFVAKKTTEYLFPHVSGISYDQGFFASIFGYGTVTFIITGMEQAPFKQIDAPKQLCTHIHEVFENEMEEHQLPPIINSPISEQAIKPKNAAS